MLKSPIAVLVLALTSFAGVACSGADTPEEPKGETTSNLSFSCMRDIKAARGTKAWTDAARACLKKPNDGPPLGHTPVTTPGDGNGDGDGDGDDGDDGWSTPLPSGSSSSSGGAGGCLNETEFECVNGACKCISGPAGTACGPGSPSGKECTELCNVCR